MQNTNLGNERVNHINFLDVDFFQYTDEELYIIKSELEHHILFREISEEKKEKYRQKLIVEQKEYQNNHDELQLMYQDRENVLKRMIKKLENEISKQDIIDLSDQSDIEESSEEIIKPKKPRRSRK